MSDLTLKNLLTEYSIKRNNELYKAQKKKEALYTKCPRLQEIDEELSSSAIFIAKKLLQSNNKNILSDFNIKKQILLKEKNEIYKSLNIDSTYLEPNYECKLCKDTGYITSNNNLTVMCNCLKQKIFDIKFNKINLIDISNNNFSQFNSNYYSDKVNSNKYNSSISPRDNIEIIKNIAIKFIKNFDNSSEKNLLFIGNTGLGKTFLSNCIANEILKQHKTILYQTAPSMLDSIIDYRLGKSKDNFNIIKNILSVDLLIIDDLGTECLNNMKFSELFTILNTRLLNQTKKVTKTIISTNLDINNLIQLYGERIVSRLIGS